MTPVSTGARLADRYRLQERIGRGGMASVFLAEDERLGRQVAVKLLEVADPDGRAADRIRREARRAAALSHPNVVAVHDSGEEDGRPFIVMEHVEGRTLADLLHDEGRLPPRRALDIAIAVCQALEAAHHRGIVHRDVKPSNVLLTDAAHVKVTDFGIARAYEGETVTQEAPLGTVAYVAPEQMAGTDADGRVDVYALGIVLYEMLTGTRPFQGETPAEVAFQRLHRRPSPPSEVAPLPQVLDVPVMRALERDPEDRYGGVAELRSDLERVRRQIAADTAPLPLMAAAEEPDSRWQRMLDRGWALLLLGLLAVAAAVAVFLLYGSAGEEETDTVRVPDVTGMTLSTARTFLEDSGLRVGDVLEARDAGPPGIVLRQDPSEGLLPAGSTVDLVVSAEPSSPSPSPTDATESPDTTEDTADDGTTGGTVGETQEQQTDDGGDGDSTEEGGGNRPDTPGHGGEPPGQGGEPPGKGKD